MYCVDCIDNEKCKIQEKHKEKERKGIGAVFTNDTLVGCNKYDNDNEGNIFLTMRTEF